MKGSLSVVARGAATVGASGSIGSLNPIDASMGGAFGGAGNLLSFVNTNGIVTGALVGAAGISGDLQPSRGGFLAGEVDVAASISGGGQLAVPSVGIIGGAATISGAVQIFAAAGALSAAACALSAYTNGIDLSGGTFTGSGGISSDFNFFHTGFLAAKSDASGSLASSPMLRERLSAETDAVGSISAAPMVQIAAVAVAAGAGSISAFANTSGIVAGEIDGAGAVAGDANPVHGQQGATYFLVGEMDGAAAVNSPAFASGAIGELSIGIGGIGNPAFDFIWAAVRAGAAAKTDAISGISGRVVVGNWGIARSSGQGSIAGSTYRVTFGAAEADALGSIFGATTIAVAGGGAEVDGAANITGNAIRQVFMGGAFIDSAPGGFSSGFSSGFDIGATGASISGKLAPVSFASGNFPGAGSVIGNPRLIVRSISGAIGGAGSMSGAISVIAQLISAPIGATAGVVGGSLLTLHQSGGFAARAFSNGFNIGTRTGPVSFSSGFSNGFH